MTHCIVFEEFRDRFSLPDTDTVRLGFEFWSNQPDFDFEDPHYKCCPAFYLCAYLENPDPDLVALAFLMDSPQGDSIDDPCFLEIFGGEEFANKIPPIASVILETIKPEDIKALPQATREYLLCHRMAHIEYMTLISEREMEVRPQDADTLQQYLELSKSLMPTTPALDRQFLSDMNEAIKSLRETTQRMKAYPQRLERKLADHSYPRDRMH